MKRAQDINVPVQTAINTGNPEGSPYAATLCEAVVIEAFLNVYSMPTVRGAGS